jgi:hypothetical protein
MLLFNVRYAVCKDRCVCWLVYAACVVYALVCWCVISIVSGLARFDRCWCRNGVEGLTPVAALFVWSVVLVSRGVKIY